MQNRKPDFGKSRLNGARLREIMYERPVTIYAEVAGATSSGHKKTGPRARVSGISKSL